MEVAVSPAEARLQHVMELGEVERYGQFEGATDDGVDIDDMNVGKN